MLHNVFVLKTNSDSDSFRKKLNQFLTKYCKETDSNASVFELNNSGKEKVEDVINQ